MSGAYWEMIEHQCWMDPILLQLSVWTTGAGARILFTGMGCVNGGLQAAVLCKHAAFCLVHLIQAGSQPCE